ncbi:MAG TPA: sensor histidine kinase KdpD [Candidatus Baltobacteraceae bacterium]|jgi:two-component system sensor histidine kinase KdpD|nr:sensor histidine kinase KdpD [Candidatus Baltobacteraceae bacterium]
MTGYIAFMAEDNRPDPDALLAAIQKSEAATKRGRFKVFLGMAAGVGKTYAMLRAAQRALREGVNVVVGYVETHGRKETEALLAGLPIIPRRKVEYRGVVLEEMDLDALLARRPRLAIVDELPHTNVPGSRHAKRYQDVIELLDAGIDVYTTMNVQHAESRVDTVRQITGSTVQETIPDSVLDGAEMELIDLPPEDLLKRLDEGKVYMPERAELAMMNFFREGNLNALREMALRLAADHVGQEVHDYLQAMQITGPWKSGHRLLVGVSGSPYSPHMIRWTRRLADSFDCPWIAVYVEQAQPLQAEVQEQLTKHLALARELGAEIITTADADIAAGILRVAQQQNVTQIIVGKPGSDGALDWIRGGRLLRRLVRQSGHIELHVIRPESLERTPAPRHWGFARESSLGQYLAALAVVGVCTAVNFLLDSMMGGKGGHTPSLVYLLGVVLLAFYVGRGPTLFNAAASALLWDYFFLPPRYTLYLTHFEDVMMFGMYFVVALVLGQLASRVRWQERAERRREKRSTALYLLTSDLSDAADLDDVAQRLVRQVAQAFNAKVALLPREPTGTLARTAHPASTFFPSEKEQSVAAWAFRFGKAAGRFTDNLPSASAIYLPLQTNRGAVGVLGVELAEDPQPTLEQRDLLGAFARQAALVLDRLRLDGEAQKAQLVAESERLSKALLNSISHELRTPIAAITAAATALTEVKGPDPLQMSKTLAAEIQESAARLNRLVSNLLDMTRLESGNVKPRLEWCDMSDLINVAVRRNERELSKHQITLSVPRPLPLVKADFVLIEQVLNNLLLNAAAYTPAGTPVEVRASVINGEMVIVVADRGPGLPAESLAHVFEKFYRVPGAPAGGTGLGLSIVKGLVEAHSGRVEVQNRPGGGAEFSIYLPIISSPEMAVEAAV